MALLLGLALWLGLGGCSCSEEPPRIEPLSKQELAKIPAVGPQDLQALLDGQKGKVVVLVVWSVRREACLAMYPKLNDLLKEGAGETVVIAVNIDRVADVRKEVLPMLAQHRPKFLNRVVRAGPEALASFVGVDWSGQVPAIAIRDRSGSKVAAFYGKRALDRAKARVAELLSAQ